MVSGRGQRQDHIRDDVVHCRVNLRQWRGDIEPWGWIVSCQGQGQYRENGEDVIGLREYRWVNVRDADYAR